MTPFFRETAWPFLFLEKEKKAREMVKSSCSFRGRKETILPLE